MSMQSKLKIASVFHTWQKSKIKIFLCCLPFFIFSIFLFDVPPIAAVDNRPINGSNQSVPLKDISILPFENLSESPVATKIISELIKKELKNSERIFVTTEDAVDEFLAKRRIRYTGGVTRLAVREMGKALGVNAVLVGTINQFSEGNGRINVAVTARLVNTVDGSIIWANTVSYTERDFVGLLGLGLITSVDSLSSRVVKDLVKGIPTQFIIKDTGLGPFEVERVDTFPTIATGGARVVLKVRVVPIKEEPKEINAVVDGTEISLVKGENGEYEGVVIVPIKEGMYPVDVVARDETMSVFLFGAAGKLVVDGTPPKVSMAVNRKIFAPQKRGYITFSPKLLSLDEIDEWEIEILDKEGQKVRGDKGYGKLPKGLIWRGETDKYTLVSDGEYIYRFMVKDIAGNKSVLTDSIRIKNNPPVIKVDVNKVEDKVQFTFKHGPDDNIKLWKLSILDKEGRPVKTIEGTGEFPRNVEYPVEAEFNVNSMAFSVTAVDNADNSFSLTKSITSVLSKKNQFAKANQMGQLAEDF
jgi:TolB-like protein